jgi:hypothetical protein
LKESINSRQSKYLSQCIRWVCCNRSSPRNCSHEALPFVEAAAKTKLEGSIETQPGHHLAAFSAFGIGDVPVVAARNKDVRCERVVFGFHCRKLGLNITYGRTESLQGVLKACRTHGCSTEHIGY